LVHRKTQATKQEKVHTLLASIMEVVTSSCKDVQCLGKIHVLEAGMVLYATHVGEEFWCLCTSDGTELFSVLVVSQYVFLGLYKNTIRIWPKFSFRFHFLLVPENTP
jgi:hypothetical protein